MRTTGPGPGVGHAGQVFGAAPGSADGRAGRTSPPVPQPEFQTRPADPDGPDQSGGPADLVGSFQGRVRRHWTGVPVSDQRRRPDGPGALRRGPGLERETGREGGRLVGSGPAPDRCDLRPRLFALVFFPNGVMEIPDPRAVFARSRGCGKPGGESGRGMEQLPGPSFRPEHVLLGGGSVAGVGHRGAVVLEGQVPTGPRPGGHLADRLDPAPHPSAAGSAISGPHDPCPGDAGLPVGRTMARHLPVLRRADDPGGTDAGRSLDSGRPGRCLDSSGATGPCDEHPASVRASPPHPSAPRSWLSPGSRLPSCRRKGQTSSRPCPRESAWV